MLDLSSSRAQKRRRLESTHNAAPSGGKPAAPESTTVSAKFSSTASQYASGLDDDIEANHMAPLEKINPSSSRQLFTPPTSQAHMQEMLLDSSTKSRMELQVDEFLSGLRLDYDRLSEKIDPVLRNLKKCIDNIPSRKAMPVVQAVETMQKVDGLAIPFPSPRPRDDVKWQLLYEKPVRVNVIGSYAQKGAVRTGNPLLVDLAVTMPPDLFQEKDYLDLRYFHKRAFYLAAIAVGLSKAKEITPNLFFHHLNGNPLHPVLIYTPFNEDIAASNIQFRIIPVAPENLFPLSKTMPKSGLVRPKANDRTTTLGSNGSTPFYNASLRCDCTVTSYLKLLHAASTICPAFKDACILGTIWLQQRGLQSSVEGGGFGHFEWAACTAVLLQDQGPSGKPILPSTYSPFQLFKAILKYFSLRDLIENPQSLPAAEFPTVSAKVPYFFDDIRGLNILFKMNEWSYKMLRHESKVTLQSLGDPVIDHFWSIFICRQRENLVKYDLLARVALGGESPFAKSNLIAHIEATDPSGSFQRLYTILKRGLTDRVALIHLMPTPTPDLWRINSLPAGADTRDVLIGFLVNAANSDRIVDHGPSAEDKEASQEYRHFWGEKAELRRFKDGRILESLVWSEKHSSTSTFQQIITFVVTRHLGDNVKKSMAFMGCGFGHTLIQHPKPSESMGLFEPMMTAYGKLERSLRSFEDIPLHLKQILPADPSLRYASLRLTTLRPNEKVGINTADVVLQFEGSGRWPDDLTAIQRTKVAFLLKIRELVLESDEDTVAHVGLENTDCDILNPAFLNIIYPQGAAFRIRIQSEREPVLLQKKLDAKSGEASNRTEAALALSLYKRSFLQSPLHTQAIRSLCTRFPLLSPTIRLTKKWFCAHYLSDHISEEVIEILVVRIFVHPSPWLPPSSVMSGFLRTLQFLSRWDWRLEPLLVDFKGDLSTQARKDIHTKFEAWRKIDPGMNKVVLFVATGHDPDGITWTQAGPSKVVAARMTALARIAYAIVKRDSLDLDPETLFTPSTSDFDFVIHLQSRFKLMGVGKPSTKGFKNLQTQPPKSSTNGSTISPVLSFVKELKSIYGSSVLFFHDADGDSSLVAGLWNRNIQARAWTINLSYSTKPIPAANSEEGTDAQLDVNKTAILHEIRRLGGDLISHIQE